MKYVNAFMMPNSKILFFISLLGIPVSDLLYIDRPRDVRPSKLLKVLAQVGVVVEIIVGPLCLFQPQLGVPLATMFHVYILSMTPFASVQEWNCACLFFVHGAFGSNFKGYSLSSFAEETLKLDPILAAFLAFVLMAVPLYGNICPKRVPFLTAYRPYAGNWRFTWHIISNKAKDKLRKLKSLEGVFISENAQMLWKQNPHFCDQFEDYFTGNLIAFPHFRPLIPIIETLQKRMRWKTDDFTTLFNEIFLNAITGWTLGTGFYVNDAFWDALVTTCDLKEGEMFCAIFEPQAIHDHTAEWHVVDVVTREKIIHGKAPYAALETFQPTEMSVEMLEACSVMKSKKE